MATETDTTITILDYIDNITVPGKVFYEPCNEFWALKFLHDGMEFLYRKALFCDKAIKQQVNPEGNIRVSGGGNLPWFNQIPIPLLTCAFHWYAISACQYVKTVGAIACKLDPNRPHPGEYAKNIIPDVVAFRDKCAAHFAWSTKNKHDNNAERLASILPPLTFTDDSFFVGGLTVVVRHRGKASNSETIKPWSLCRVHEKLRKRYWPHEQTGRTVRGDAIAEQTDERELE
jgi:hypothetical protein